MHRHGGHVRPPIRLATRLALALAIASVFFAAPATAQDVPFRIDDNAMAVARGVLRFGIGADFSYAEQLRTPDGARIPLGRRLGFDSATDNVVASAAVSTTRLPISLAYGVTRWLTIGASAPLVRRRVEIAADTNVQRPPGTKPTTRLADASALAGFTHTNVGDVDLTARVALFDSFGHRGPLRLRIAAEGGMRVGAGPSRTAISMVDPGAGDGQNDVLASVHADVALGAHWSLSAAGSQTWQRPDRQTIVSPDSVYPSRQVRGSVERDLGDIRSVTIVPRYRLTRYIELAASLSQLTKTADRYAGVTPAEGWGLIAPPAASYGITRVGGGVILSTLPNGHAIWGWPVDLVFEHNRIVHSSGVAVPDTHVDRLGGRVYIKLF